MKYETPKPLEIFEDMESCEKWGKTYPGEWCTCVLHKPECRSVVCTCRPRYAVFPFTPKVTRALQELDNEWEASKTAEKWFQAGVDSVMVLDETSKNGGILRRFSRW